MRSHVAVVCNAMLLFAALLARCLEVLIQYLPRIRLHFAAYLADNKASMLRHVDNLQEEYRQHVQLVHRKIGELAAAMIDDAVSQVRWQLIAR